MIRAFLAFLIALAPGCALLPPSHSAGDLTSPIVQASWEAVTPPPAVDGAELLDEALSACTGPLAFGVSSGDAVSIAQWCDCYRERAETDRHAYRQVCVPGVSSNDGVSTIAAEPRASPDDAPCAAPHWPDLRDDLDDALGALRRSRADLAASSDETDALRVRAEALRRVGAGCRLVAGKDSFHQIDTTTWACTADAVRALELAVTP